MRFLATIPALMLCWATLANAALPQVPISACGDVVPRKTLGYLTTDLDCTGFNGTPGAVMVSKGSVLELRGHTITGGNFGVVCGELRPRPDLPPALYIEGKCRIDGGGGSILASDAHGIAGFRTTIANVTIDGAGQVGVYAIGPGTFENVTITDSGLNGVDGQGIRITATTITGNGRHGIGARTVRAFGSTVTNNGVGPDCGGPLFPNLCVDLVTRRRPVLHDSQCGRSLVPVRVNPPLDWNVCLFD